MPRLYTPMGVELCLTGVSRECVFEAGLVRLRSLADAFPNIIHGISLDVPGVNYATKFAQTRIEKQNALLAQRGFFERLGAGNNFSQIAQSAVHHSKIIMADASNKAKYRGYDDSFCCR